MSKNAGAPSLARIWQSLENVTLRPVETLAEALALCFDVSVEDIEKGSMGGETMNGKPATFTIEQADSPSCVWGFVHLESNQITGYAASNATKCKRIGFLSHELMHVANRMVFTVGKEDLDEEIMCEAVRMVTERAVEIERGWPSYLLCQ